MVALVEKMHSPHNPLLEFLRLVLVDLHQSQSTGMI